MDKKEIDIIKKTIQGKQELLLKYKTEFKNNRVIGFYFIGSACEKGNRKFFFDFNNNKVIFKPNRNTSIEIEVKIPKNKRKLFNQLQLLTDNKLIPLTVRVINNDIIFGYDNELLNGFSFNNIECKKQQKLVDTPEEKKEIYKEFITELENRKKQLVAFMLTQRLSNENKQTLLQQIEKIDKLNQHKEQSVRLIHDFEKLKNKFKL
jgi:hypothetical protein